MTEYHLTPTQDMIMEVLAARYRLGEVLWPFPNNVKRQAKQLEELGLVGLHSGQTDGHFRLGLTGAGMKERGLDKPYDPPLLQGKTIVPAGTSSFIMGGGSSSVIGSGGGGGGAGRAYPAARTTKTRADDWKAGFDAGWEAREERP
jgi:hypothetical protein